MRADARETGKLQLISEGVHRENKDAREVRGSDQWLIRVVVTFAWPVLPLPVRVSGRPSPAMNPAVSSDHLVGPCDERSRDRYAKGLAVHRSGRCRS